ncbi:hypothetical protein NQ314_005735 [Rhamnusium bicolor]|uniref:Uncharacterized protein n=1 Tax=Rhamnusium bicolor TaxID=1586634 RepID=A0AAV8ZDY3_9CUCU|nr:hypothetical protein NQ314_005735 [Rhamnusium bicolor]
MWSQYLKKLDLTPLPTCLSTEHQEYVFTVALRRCHTEQGGHVQGKLSVHFSMQNGFCLLVFRCDVGLCLSDKKNCFLAYHIR